MNNYFKAVEALKECVKDSIDDDKINGSDQSEIWRHYQGMKAIAAKLSSASEYREYTFRLQDTGDIKIETSDYDPDYNVQAAGPVDLGLVGNDVITFSQSLPIDFKLDGVWLDDSRS